MLTKPYAPAQLCTQEVCITLCSQDSKQDVVRGGPVVTRFFWPPLMPRTMSLPTSVSWHTCTAPHMSQAVLQGRSLRPARLPLPL